MPSSHFLISSILMVITQRLYMNQNGTKNDLTKNYANNSYLDNFFKSVLRLIHCHQIAYFGILITNIHNYCCQVFDVDGGYNILAIAKTLQCRCLTMPCCFKQKVKDVLSWSICQTCCHNVSDKLGLVCFSMFDDKLLCTDVGFEVWMGSPAAVVILREWYLWVILCECKWKIITEN